MNYMPVSGATPESARFTLDWSGESYDHSCEERPAVLLVEDDDLIRATYKRILVDAGLRVVCASSGEKALAFLQEVGNSISAVVTDLVLPGVDGLKLLREVRRCWAEIPVIIVTGKPHLESAVEAVNLGGFRYLTKPVTPSRLVGAVGEAISLHRLALLKSKALSLEQDAKGEVCLPTSFREQFDHALQGLWVAFQPIVDLQHGTTYGYEALIRSRCPTLSEPPQLVLAAEQLGRVHDLSRRMRAVFAERARVAPNDLLLFVNLHAFDLRDDELFRPSSLLAPLADRIVFEVTDRDSFDERDDLTNKVAELRSLGYRIAIDDLGAGYAGLSSFTQLEPDVVKLDISLIHDVDKSSCRQCIVRSMIHVCVHELDIDVICEGVETESERATLVSLGACLAQGYLFGMPVDHFGEALIEPLPRSDGATRLGSDPSATGKVNTQ